MREDIVKALEEVFQKAFEDFTEERFFSEEEMSDFKTHFYKHYWANPVLASVTNGKV